VFSQMPFVGFHGWFSNISGQLNVKRQFADSQPTDFIESQVASPSPDCRNGGTRTRSTRPFRVSAIGAPQCGQIAEELTLGGVNTRRAARSLASSARDCA
jgi:hypothetical protein